MLILYLGFVFWFTVAMKSEASGECTVDGKTFQVGEPNIVEGHCSGNICTEDGSWAQVACGLVGVPYKWIYVTEDSSEPYPECCGHAVPPLDIVPDMLEDLQYADSLDITYAGGLQVDMGNELTPTQVKLEPSVSYRSDPESVYLLVMTDPDVPSRENRTEGGFLNWLVGNIAGNDVAGGEVIAAYIGSGSSEGSGLQRYVFLLYKQPERLDFDEPRLNNTSTYNRYHFHVQELADKYNLGDPVALNVYQAQWDESVPELHEKIGLC